LESFAGGPFGGRSDCIAVRRGLRCAGVMAFSPEILTILGLLAAVVAGFALYVATTSTPKAARKIADDRQAVLMLTKHDQDVARLGVAVRQLDEEVGRQAAQMSSFVQRVGLVRYDAFEDMGGHLSFSAALLDGNGNGLVITSINGRQDTRCYAKPVESWSSEHNLSEEEEAAIRQALASEPPTLAVATEAQGRRRAVRA
jgi:Protein of unknown function (DUF4446)